MIKITTKRGDGGQTGLDGALRVPKHNYLIQIIGSLDELQSVIGLLKVELKNRRLLAELSGIQKILSQLMAFLSNSKASVNPKLKQDLRQLEKELLYWQNKSKIGRQFVVPGHNPQEIRAHLARVKTRQTERLLCQYASKSKKIKSLIPFINRLSDYFFVISQYLLNNK